MEDVEEEAKKEKEQEVKEEELDKTRAAGCKEQRVN